MRALNIHPRPTSRDVSGAIDAASEPNFTAKAFAADDATAATNADASAAFVATADNATADEEASRALLSILTDKEFLDKAGRSTNNVRDLFVRLLGSDGFSLRAVCRKLGFFYARCNGFTEQQLEAMNERSSESSRAFPGTRGAAFKGLLSESIRNRADLTCDVDDPTHLGLGPIGATPPPSAMWCAARRRKPF